MYRGLRACPVISRYVRVSARMTRYARNAGFTLAEKTSFIVMELLHGRDLAAMLAEAPAGLPIDAVVPLAIQAAEALRAAHAGHVVHRDLKPANLFVLDGGLLKICDFGIAWAVDSTHLTVTGQAIGTPAYMSPEQCRGEQVDKRSDLYSLGCVLYALLTGQPPFAEGQPLAIMLQHLNTAPAAPRTIRPDVPPELDRLVLDLLAKDPARRPDECRVIAALQALCYTPTVQVEPIAQGSTRLDPGSPGRPRSATGFEPTMTVTDTSSVQPATITRMPRTEAERQQVLLARDIGWEYLYFAGRLLYERDSAEAKYSDREIHYSAPGVEAVTADDIVRCVEYVDQRFDDAMSLAREVNVIINMNDEAAMEQAFGAAFQPGDPERLAQLAKRWNGFYVGFLEWAASLRGINVPFELRNLLEIAARFADEPLAKYRRFVDEYVAQVDEFPARIAAGEPLRIEGSINLSSPGEAARDYVAELNRLRDRLQQPPGTYKSPPPLPYMSGQEWEPTCPVCGLPSALHTGAPCAGDR